MRTPHLGVYRPFVIRNPGVHMASAPATKTAPARATADEAEARERATRPRFDSDDFFGAQPASTSSLPDPTPPLENLTRCVIEVLAGARDLEQLARWVSDDVCRHLLKRKCNLSRQHESSDAGDCPAVPKSRAAHFRLASRVPTEMTVACTLCAANPRPGPSRDQH